MTEKSEKGLYKPKDPAKEKLTAKQRNFVVNFHRHGDMLEAALEAGYTCNGKDRTMWPRELLKMPKIKAALAALGERKNQFYAPKPLEFDPDNITLSQQEKMQQRKAELSEAWVVSKLMDEAESVVNGATPASRIKSLELLGKYLGIFIEKHDLRLSTEDGQIARIKEARRRVISGILKESTDEPEDAEVIT